MIKANPDMIMTPFTITRLSLDAVNTAEVRAFVMDQDGVTEAMRSEEVIFLNDVIISFVLIFTLVVVLLFRGDYIIFYKIILL